VFPPVFIEGSRQNMNHAPEAEARDADVAGDVFLLAQH
jgi:hypothetical protein